VKDKLTQLLRRLTKTKSEEHPLKKVRNIITALGLFRVLETDSSSSYFKLGYSNNEHLSFSTNIYLFLVNFKCITALFCSVLSSVWDVRTVNCTITIADV